MSKKFARTLVETNDTLCFHLASQHWLQLIAIIFCRETRIHILDRLTFTPETPIPTLEARSSIHNWSYRHMGDRPLHRTIWEDRGAVFGHLTPQPTNNHEEDTGKWLITQSKIRPNLVPWIIYCNTHILQAPGTVVMCCPAYLQSHSATVRYIIREYGQENIFRLKLSLGNAIRLKHSPTAPWDNQIVLMCTRASYKHPLLHETRHICLTYLSHQLHQYGITQIHIPIFDPERSINLLPAWYDTLRDHFTGQNLEIILHDRVYVSIESITSIDIKAN